MSAPTFVTLDDVRDFVCARRARNQEQAMERARITISDKAWSPVCELRGELAVDAEKIANDTGEANITIPGDHLLVTWLLDPALRQSDVHVSLKTTYWEWHGKSDTIQRVYKAGEMVAVRLHFLHDYEQAKKVTCFANPALPAEIQVPKAMPFAGPSASGVNLYGMTNLWRIQSLNAVPDNIFNPSQWSATFDWSRWWTTMVPINPLTDTSRWSVMTSRFANFHDLISPTLWDAGLLVSADRWFPGDPQPMASFFEFDHPMRVLRVQDKSGYSGPTGTFVDGLLNLVGTTAEDYINEIITLAARPDVPEYKLPGWFGTHRSAPWVVFPEGKYATVSESTMTIHKAMAYAMVTGGKSPQWVNSAAKLAANAALGYLGALIGNPGLALGVFDFLVEDTILAFHRVANPILKQAMGPDAYFEKWVQGPGVGFTLSTLQAIRTGFWDSRGYTSYTAKIDANAPYVPGKHFDLMDRIGFEIQGNWYVDNVHSIKYSHDRNTLPSWDISIGNDQAEEEPSAKLMRYKENIMALIQQQGVGV